MYTYEVYKHSQPHRSTPHAHPGPRSSSRMHGLKPRLRGVHMATLPVCVRGFAVSCKCMSVVRRSVATVISRSSIYLDVRPTHGSQRGGFRFGRRRPSEAPEPIDAGRRMVASDPQCSRGMHGVHPGPLGEVARRLPPRGYLLHRRALKKRKGPSIAPRQGQVGSKGFRAIQNRSVPAKDLI